MPERISLMKKMYNLNRKSVIFIAFPEAIPKNTKPNLSLRVLGIALLTVIICFSACNNAVQHKVPAFEQFLDNPITITWRGETKEVESFQANVMVFSMNNRKDTAATLSETYRMSMSTIENKILTRLDYEYDRDLYFNAVMTDGEEILIFNSVTNEIGRRMPIENSNSPLYRIFNKQTGLSRINLSLIRSEAARLALDMKEGTENGNNVLLLEIPPALVPQNGYDTIISSRAVFDISSETLVETKVVMLQKDNTIVSTTVKPVYEILNGIPIKIGQITEIDSKAPCLFEGINPNTQYYNSPDEIPELTIAELKDLQSEGIITEVLDMTFGNPADMSYVETIYEVYQNIEINSTPEYLFRLIKK